MSGMHHEFLGNGDRAEVLSGVRRKGAAGRARLSAVRGQREGALPKMQWNWKNPGLAPFGYLKTGNTREL